MRIIVQRSKKSKCIVNNKIVGEINQGMVLLVGFTEGDSFENINYLINKVLALRIFPDKEGIMNRSILELEHGEILSISQFTLYASTNKGSRPSYIKALNGTDAKKLYDLFNRELEKHIHVETGIFGADMEVQISNDGPVTICLER